MPAQPPGDSKTDGWTWSDGPEKGKTSGATLNPWAGTAGQNTNSSDPRPYDYEGSAALNWAARITRAGDSLEISREDAFKRYVINADIDTAGGAWRDVANNLGWAHNTDIGLFKSDVTTDVTLKLTAVNGPIAHFGITVFTGMDTGANYTHHTQWNTPPTAPFTKSNPFGTTGVQYVDGLGVNSPNNDSYLFGVTSTDGFTFKAEADKIYSIYLGGYLGEHWNQQHDRYRLSISTPEGVPVPSAVWLMGSGLLGLLSFGRRKKMAANAI